MPALDADQKAAPARCHARRVFKHILIPTDGSRLALKGAKAGVKLASALGARVTALFVIQPYFPAMYGEAAIYVPAVSPREYRKASAQAAKRALAAVEAQARAAGVACAAATLRATSTCA